MKPGFSNRRAAGFTIIELVTVIILVGILGAVGASRFFDNTAFDNRAYADQARSIIRYAQKTAIAQNRPIFVRANGDSFAVCSAAACGAGTLIAPPSGTSSGSSGTRTYCQQNNTYSANWLCEGRPSGVAISGAKSLFFDALGRPYNSTDSGTVSTFTQTTMTFTSGGNSAQIVIAPETGYVQ